MDILGIGRGGEARVKLIQNVVLNGTGSYFVFALDSTDSFLHVFTQQSSLMQNVTANTLSVLKMNG